MQSMVLEMFRMINTVRPVALRVSYSWGTCRNLPAFQKFAEIAAEIYFIFLCYLNVLQFF